MDYILILIHKGKKHSQDWNSYAERELLQMECAKSYGADYIVTRNVSDYVTSEVKAIEPKDYLRL